LPGISDVVTGVFSGSVPQARLFQCLSRSNLPGRGLLPLTGFWITVLNDEDEEWALSGGTAGVSLVGSSLMDRPAAGVRVVPWELTDWLKCAGGGGSVAELKATLSSLEISS